VRFHIENPDGGNLCGSPGETHSVEVALGEDDFWCSMCARIYNGVSK